ncbi:MAG: prepilin-type N-terminal cleavage/methylation domain-containing protein [Puniceicoccaceae bacterium]|nr:MAG: prepilin-type N-terminal cleavage/methylation domain-containing protein [Puniceicoccaceae bacterium]
MNQLANFILIQRRSPARAGSHRRGGFSLIEVVIAVAVFAMAATVLVSAFTNALLARERGLNIDMLNADIRAVRMQLLLQPNIEEAERGGLFETLSSGRASWEARIEPTDVVDLFRVQFSMDFSDPPEDLPDTYEETLYLLRPTWSQSDERSQLLQDKRTELENMRGRLRF